nr:hypothetical protein [Tanacetum cinerariifolium]
MSPGKTFLYLKKGPPKFSLWRHLTLNDNLVVFPADMSPGKVAWDVSSTKTRYGFTGVKSAAGLSPQSSRAKSTTEPSLQCQQMWHGATAVTVAVMIIPLHTLYPPVAGVASLTETQFDLTPHMQSQRWTDINAGI